MDSKLTELPPSFAQALRDDYLGSPTVVAAVLEGFIGEMLDWIGARSAGVMTAEQMATKAYARSVDFADIFAGENENYTPVLGWNTRVGGLDSYLRVDLGKYWVSQRAACGDDPFRVMYAYVLWTVADSLQLNDDALTAQDMGERSQTIVRLLTGTLKRL